MQTKAKFVLSKTVALEKYKEMRALADFVSYSMKTNFEVGKILQETDSFFSVHSLESLKLIDNKSKAWFFAQAWNEEEIDELFSLGVSSFVVDNTNDLTALLNFIEKHRKKINLLLRMRLKEHTIHTGKHFVFGFYSKEVNKLIPELRENKNIDKLGIHFHRKTQNVSEWSLKDELQENLNESTIKCLDLVNIGGGLPSRYKNFRETVLTHIFSKIKEVKEWLNSENIKMIVEPGRIIAAPSIKLEVEIVNIYKNNIVINCSVYNSAMDTFVANIRMLVDGEQESGETYTIKGCTPDSLDIFRYSVFLKDPKVGDKIIFLNAGAYNFSTEFCKLPKLETVIV